VRFYFGSWKAFQEGVEAVEVEDWGECDIPGKLPVTVLVKPRRRQLSLRCEALNSSVVRRNCSLSKSRLRGTASGVEVEELAGFVS